MEQTRFNIHTRLSNDTKYIARRDISIEKKISKFNTVADFIATAYTNATVATQGKNIAPFTQKDMQSFIRNFFKGSVLCYEDSLKKFEEFSSTKYSVFFKYFAAELKKGIVDKEIYYCLKHVALQGSYEPGQEEKTLFFGRIGDVTKSVQALADLVTSENFLKDIEANQEFDPKHSQYNNLMKIKELSEKKSPKSLDVFNEYHPAKKSIFNEIRKIGESKNLDKLIWFSFAQSVKSKMSHVKFDDIANNTEIMKFTDKKFTELTFKFNKDHNGVSVSIIKNKKILLSMPINERQYEDLLYDATKISEHTLHMEKLNFSDTSLNGLCLTNCNFNHSTFKNVTFMGTTLQSTEMMHCKMYDINMDGAKLESIKLNKSEIKNISFVETKISETIFEDTYMKNGIFQNSELQDVNMNDAVFEQIIFRNIKSENLSCSDAKISITLSEDLSTDFDNTHSNNILDFIKTVDDKHTKTDLIIQVAKHLNKKKPWPLPLLKVIAPFFLNNAFSSNNSVVNEFILDIKDAIIDIGNKEYIDFFNDDICEFFLQSFQLLSVTEQKNIMIENNQFFLQLYSYATRDKNTALAEKYRHLYALYLQSIKNKSQIVEGAIENGASLIFYDPKEDIALATDREFLKKAEGKNQNIAWDNAFYFVGGENILIKNPTEDFKPFSIFGKKVAFENENLVLQSYIKQIVPKQLQEIFINATATKSLEDVYKIKENSKEEVILNETFDNFMKINVLNQESTLFEFIANKDHLLNIFQIFGVDNASKEVQSQVLTVYAAIFAYYSSSNIFGEAGTSLLVLRNYSSALLNAAYHLNRDIMPEKQYCAFQNQLLGRGTSVSSCSKLTAAAIFSHAKNNFKDVYNTIIPLAWK